MSDNPCNTNPIILGTFVLYFCKNIFKGYLSLEYINKSETTYSFDCLNLELDTSTFKKKYIVLNIIYIKRDYF